MGHEIRQPLTAASLAAGNALFMLSELPPSNEVEQIKKRVSRALDQVNRTLEIIDSVGQLYSPRSDKIGDADFYQAIDNVENLLNHQLAEQGINLSIPSARIAFTAVKGDQIGLEQVLTNCIINAATSIKARRHLNGGANGEIGISLSNEGDMVRCDIVDNGNGPSDVVASQAFEPFYSTTRQVGSGLGLFISRELVTRAGGSITLTRNADIGATVTIRLKAADQNPA